MNKSGKLYKWVHVFQPRYNADQVYNVKETTGRPTISIVDKTVCKCWQISDMGDFSPDSVEWVGEVELANQIIIRYSPQEINSFLRRHGIEMVN